MTLLNRMRSVFHPVCAACGGEGGSSGYYGDDWCGCYVCNPNEDNEDAVTRVWPWRLLYMKYQDWKMNRWVDQQVKNWKE